MYNLGIANDDAAVGVLSLCMGVNKMYTLKC